MTIARVARELETLSKRVAEGFARVDERFAHVDERFAQVDERFAQVDDRFARVDQRFDDLERRLDGKFEAFETRIVERVRILIEALRSDFQVVIDRTKATDERLDRFMRENAEEHRLFQTQIDDLDSRVPPRRSTRRRPS